MSSPPVSYQRQLEDGQAYQDFIAERLYREGIVLVNLQSRASQLAIGENLLGLEIKLDKQFEKTGNLYIEVAEKSHAARHDYVPSGIYRDDNSWLYGIGDYREFFIFSKRTLKNEYEFARRDTSDCKKIATSLGFILSRIDAVSLAERCFVFR